ncbi:MAG: glycosyltransferase [Lachnospiraceae bacterium]|nr:glycosyltransferase [Lachnospiraceae bacterium]
MNTKQDVHICFLVLHYLDIELTAKTIESIRGLNNFGNSKIVVVDNASPNGSGELLEQKYKERKDVHIILSESNNGFSAGNNIGFLYIKHNFISDFVITVNNDVLFPQKDFIDKLDALYKLEPFWIAGPDIYEPHRDYHSSPMYEHSLSAQEAEKVIKNMERERQKLVKKFSLYGIKLYVRDCLRENYKIRLFIRLNRLVRGQKRKYRERSEGIVLQGACLIFDKRYCDKNSELFLPLTFMYGEEILLTLQCVKNNWEIRYFPELIVWHFSRGSSQCMKMSYREYCKKVILELDRRQEAYRIYTEQL